MILLVNEGGGGGGVGVGGKGPRALNFFPQLVSGKT